MRTWIVIGLLLVGSVLAEEGELLHDEGHWEGGIIYYLGCEGETTDIMVRVYHGKQLAYKAMIPLEQPSTILLAQLHRAIQTTFWAYGVEDVYFWKIRMCKIRV